MHRVGIVGAGSISRVHAAAWARLPVELAGWHDVVPEAAVAAAERWGGIDVYLANAGIEGQLSPIPDYPIDVFDRVMAVNVRGVWLGIKYVVPVMRERGGGSIVITSSTAGIGAGPDMSAYTTSKHAVIGMTETAAIELAPAGIRVNAVCPGPVDTRMLESIAAGKFPDDPDLFLKRSDERNPMGRRGKPEEVVALVTFLASEDASYINGGWHTVDGGWAAG